ncbi:monooxygenase (plasmid) [Mycolicibacterium madagascariense]|uniref:Monooxygenase n=1 Tax=Mycolicibacterium madagascariense TaxID=212765 RepID=A0A7I7XPS0_9MYCO|nr:NAD(P)/FAD-dependent oxidoreductase [Mycolicibacterium madagascariense]BBZ31241.1 monooxygenase [Mycolicibacterium madagascariense]
MTQLLPDTSPPAVDTDYRAVALAWLGDFNDAVSAGNVAGVVDLLAEDPWWRDLYALTWDLTGMHGHDDIGEVLAAALPDVGMGSVELDEHYPVRLHNDTYIEAMYTFTTNVATGRGVIRLANEAGQWVAIQLSTLLTGLKEFPFRFATMADVDLPEFNYAVPAGQRKSTTELAEERRAFTQSEPSVLVIGAGHSGMFLAAHLERLGVPTLLVDRYANAGDNWRLRYSGLALHDLKWAVQFPYMPFPPSWPVFLSKDFLADWLEQYVTNMELNLWTSTTVHSAVYDQESGRWTVQLDRDGEARTLHPNHLVIATGLNGLPKMPDIEGMAEFAGQIVHSSGYQGGRTATGKRVVVVGSGSSGHDVAQDAYENGATTVTMVQRSPTYVYSQNRGVPIQFGSFYGHDHMLIDDADLLASISPTALARKLGPIVTRKMADVDAELLQGLEAAGFRTTLGPDDAGLTPIATTGGAYYIDKGASKLIIEGKIRIQQGDIARFTATGVQYADGTEEQADIVVLCTGYTNVRESVRPILGDEVTDGLATVWNIDSRGEVRTSMRHSGHEKLWFVANGLRIGRMQSKPVAVMIKAIDEGLLDPHISVVKKSPEPQPVVDAPA